MGSVTDYVLVEPTNMQQALDREHHRSLVPRFIAQKDGEEYCSSFYCDAVVNSEKSADGYVVSGVTGLASRQSVNLEGVNPKITYTLKASGLYIDIERAKSTKYILPLINGEVKILHGNQSGKDDIFFLTGGFTAKEYTLTPDENGNLNIVIF